MPSTKRLQQFVTSKSFCMNEDSPKFRELLSLEREYTLLERNIVEVSKALVTAKRDYENTESLEWKQRVKDITRTLRISRRVPDCDSREIVKEKQHELFWLIEHRKD